MGAQENEDVILTLQEATELKLTWPSGTAPNMWKELKNMLQPDDRLSEMLMEEDLHSLKFTKKEEPKKLALKIAKITMRYKVKFSDSKRAAHIVRLGRVHYTYVLTDEERACRRSGKRSCNSKVLLECMTNTWKMRGGIPDGGSNDKAADELALTNLQNWNTGKGFQGNCYNCSKKGHKSED